MPSPFMSFGFYMAVPQLLYHMDKSLKEKFDRDRKCRCIRNQIVREVRQMVF